VAAIFGDRARVERFSDAVRTHYAPLGYVWPFHVAEAAWLIMASDRLEHPRASFPMSS